MNRLKNKICIVTGSGSGIGKASALLLAEEGAKVVVVDLNEDNAKSTEKEINNSNGEAISLKINVSDENEVKNMIDKTIEKFGKVDILHNNVGIVPANDSIFDLSGDEWTRAININLKSAFLCTKYAVQNMIENKTGNIVYTASIIGIIGEPGSSQLSYAISKGGIMGMVKQLSADLAPHKIRVNSVCPGYTDTPALRAAFSTGVQAAETWKEHEELHLLNRFADPKEIAHAVLFLASNESSFITGTNLVVDGGFTAR